MSGPPSPARMRSTCRRAGPWHDSQFTVSVVQSVRYARATESKATRIWLPWHSWQLAKRG